MTRMTSVSASSIFKGCAGTCRLTSAFPNCTNLAVTIMGSDVISHLAGKRNTDPTDCTPAASWSKMRRPNPYLLTGRASFKYGWACWESTTTTPDASAPMAVNGIWLMSSLCPCLNMPIGIDTLLGDNEIFTPSFLWSCLAFFSPKGFPCLTRFLITSSNSEGITNCNLGVCALASAFSSAQGRLLRTTFSNDGRPILSNTSCIAWLLRPLILHVGWVDQWFSLQHHHFLPPQNSSARERP